MNAGNKSTPSTHHPRRRNVTTLMVGLKKRSHTQKSHPKVVNPRDIAGERKKKKKIYIYIYSRDIPFWSRTLDLSVSFFVFVCLVSCLTNLLKQTGFYKQLPGEMQQLSMKSFTYVFQLFLLCGRQNATIKHEIIYLCISTFPALWQTYFSVVQQGQMSMRCTNR